METPTEGLLLVSRRIIYWTKEEDQKIIDNFDLTKAEWEALLPGRTYKAISNRARILGSTLKSPIWTETTKKCSMCQQWKPFDQFNKVGDKKRRNPDAPRSLCRKCEAERHDRFLYNLSPHQKDGLKKFQNNACVICGKQVKLVVDHCHTEGVVRGLLCDIHNKGLGAFQDNIEHLLAAIAYLKDPTYPRYLESLTETK